MANLNIQAEQEQGSVPVTVLRIEGDIDAGTFTQLQEKAAEVIQAGAANILLDLGQVNFMASAGFRAVHAIANQLDTEKKPGVHKSENVKLLNPTGDVARVIKVLGFDSFLEIYSDRSTALASFQA